MRSFLSLYLSLVLTRMIRSLASGFVLLPMVTGFQLSIEQTWSLNGTRNEDVMSNCREAMTGY